MKVWQDAMKQWIAQGIKNGRLVTVIEDTREAAVKGWERA